jgi:hypothetical protein
MPQKLKIYLNKSSKEKNRLRMRGTRRESWDGRMAIGHNMSMRYHRI